MERLDPATLNFNPRATDITALIARIEESFKQQIPAGVVLNCVYGASECVMDTDPDLLAQVLRNLVSNACKFTVKGAITVGYEEYEEEIYFFVKDTGSGLSREARETIEGILDGTAGNVKGMGLVMTAAMVKAMGGTCGVESRGEGKGSSFWFTIPYKEAKPAAQESTSAFPASSVTASSAPAATSGRRLTMLIAEDNESNYLLFKTILQQKYNLVRAHDGVEAVEQFKTTSPDIILMDINMPNMDGYEAVKIIRTMSTTVPVIAVTAYAFITDRRRILDNGFNGYVSKPVNVKRLEQEIAQCLGEKETK